ncbi:hypothetical protein ACFTY7_02385, partial [Streptomyces sp. NPDC057062]
PRSPRARAHPRRDRESRCTPARPAGGGRPRAAPPRPPPTKSGYKWSSAEGPPFILSSMTLATGSIRLADQRPVDWLLP